MKLLTLCLLSVGSILNVAVAATLHIAVVTAAEFENPNRGRSFAGIQTRPERSVQRAVELALFESSTSFNAFGIDAQLEVIDLNKDRPLKDQIEQIHPEALVLVDRVKTEALAAPSLVTRRRLVIGWMVKFIAPGTAVISRITWRSMRS